jgi:hypothetical protein
MEDWDCKFLEDVTTHNTTTLKYVHQFEGLAPVTYSIPTVTSFGHFIFYTYPKISFCSWVTISFHFFNAFTPLSFDVRNYVCDVMNPQIISNILTSLLIPEYKSCYRSKKIRISAAVINPSSSYILCFCPEISLMQQQVVLLSYSH